MSLHRFAMIRSYLVETRIVNAFERARSPSTGDTSSAHVNFNATWRRNTVMVHTGIRQRP
jgi:hypothetical protein